MNNVSLGDWLIEWDDHEAHHGWLLAFLDRIAACSCNKAGNLWRSARQTTLKRIEIGRRTAEVGRVNSDGSRDI